MLDLKFVGNWVLLESEIAPSFLNHALNCDRLKNNYPYYKDNFLNMTLSHCKNKRSAIDIGASYGFVSNELSFIFDKVVSFEIVPKIRTCLKLNLSNRSNVLVEDCGLSNVNGKCDVIFYNTYTGHSSCNTATGNIQRQIPYEVIVAPVKTLDFFNFKEVDFIKIDVETVEPNVLLGAKNTILYNSPVIMLEMHKNNKKMQGKVFEILHSCEYKRVLSYYDDHVFIKKE
jgi:FkbM family methyltransferase